MICLHCIFVLLVLPLQTPTSSSTCNQVCNAPFVEVGCGKCFLYGGTAPNIRRAHTACHFSAEIHGAYAILISTDLESAIQVLPTTTDNKTRYVWTGINDLLLDRNQSRVGWRAVNADLKDVVVQIPDDKWLPGEPTSGDTLMLQTDGKSYKLHTSELFPMQYDGHVVCQLVSDATVKRHTESSRMTQFSKTYPVSVTEFFGDNKDHFWKMSVAKSLGECALT